MKKNEEKNRAIKTDFATKLGHEKSHDYSSCGLDLTILRLVRGFGDDTIYRSPHFKTFLNFFSIFFTRIFFLINFYFSEYFLFHINQQFLSSFHVAHQFQVNIKEVKHG